MRIILSLLLLFPVAVLAEKTEETDSLREKVIMAAERNGEDPGLIRAVIHVESRFKRRQISSAGAYGLMQVRYKIWKKECGLTRPEDLFDVDTNIDCGTYAVSYTHLTLPTICSV